MFHSQKTFLRAGAFVLTAADSGKKQQRITLHCGKKCRVAWTKNYAAFRQEDGISCAGLSRFIRIVQRRCRPKARPGLRR
jgi:hypothetical protein